MPQHRLAESLRQLHDELHAAPDLDADTRELLRVVVADIDALLRDGPAAGDAAGDADGPSLMDRLSDATRDFETSHPRLMHAVGQVADALSGMGI